MGGPQKVVLPVSTTVLTGNKKGGWSPKNELPVSTIVLTGKKKGGWSPQNILPVSTMVLTGKKRVGGPSKMSYQLVRGGTLLIL